MHQRGFSLLEILVAFSILALSLGVLMQIYSDTARNAELAHDQARAISLAQSLLAGASVEPVSEAAERTGSVDEKFQWKVQISRFEDEDSGAGSTVPTSAVLFDLWRINASVTWAGPPARSVALATLRARPRLVP